MTPADKLAEAARDFLYFEFRSDCLDDGVYYLEKYRRLLEDALREYDKAKALEQSSPGFRLPPEAPGHTCVDGKTKDYPAVLCSRCKPQGQFVPFVEGQSSTDLRVKDHGEQ